jgi:hypothetical protein
MDTEQHGATQEKPADEKMVPSAAGQGHNQPRQGPRRPRFKRDHRGGRGDRRDREPRPDHGGPAEGEHRKPSGSIRMVIDQVEQIRSELKKALDDIHEALRMLEQVEREKTASEEEIDLLRESLRTLQRDHGHGRPLRNPAPRPSPAPSHVPEETETSEDSDQSSPLGLV